MVSHQGHVKAQLQMVWAPIAAKGACWLGGLKGSQNKQERLIWEMENVTGVYRGKVQENKVIWIKVQGCSENSLHEKRNTPHRVTSIKDECFYNRKA